MTYDEIVTIAESLNWKINPSQIESGVNLLKELSLVTG